MLFFQLVHVIVCTNLLLELTKVNINSVSFFPILLELSY